MADKRSCVMRRPVHILHPPAAQITSCLCRRADAGGLGFGGGGVSVRWLLNSARRPAATVGEGPTGQGRIGRGEIPPLQGVQSSLCPATVPLTPGAGLNGICNRQ